MVGQRTGPICARCDLTAQIKNCGLALASIREVPASRHAWGDVAACPYEDCGRQFLFTRKKVDPEDDGHEWALA